MLVSFVIPIYKTEEKVFSKLINSINSQLHKNLFECIFIIDEINSYNKYKKIIEILNQEVNFKIIENEKNFGSGESRNIGITNAKGKYIGFIDSDDYISSKFIKLIVEFDAINNSDLVRINYTKNTQIKEIIEIKNYKDFKKTIIPGWAPFTMLVKKDFILKYNLFFPLKSNYGEDIYFFLLIMCNIKTWYEINDHLYFYNRNNNNSITSTTHKNYFNAFCKVKKTILLAKTKINKDQIKKFKFYKKYIWKRIIKNFLYNFFGKDRSNI